MKRLIVLVCICALTLFGCASRSPVEVSGNSGSVPEQESAQSGGQIISLPENSASEQAPAASQDYGRIIKELSIHRLDDFASAASIPPDGMVTFFFLANYDGEGKLPIPEGYRQSDGYTLVFPTGDVEDFVTKYLPVSVDHLRGAQCYTDKGYEIPSLGLGGSAAVRVTKVDESSKDAVKIYFEVDVTVAGEDGKERTISPAAKRVLTLNTTSGIKLAKLETTYTASME